VYIADMAPVTGGIADGKKDRLVLCLRLYNGFFTPGKPVHRIVCMLQQVGGFLVNQSIGLFAG